MASFVTAGKKIMAIGRNYGLHAKELGNAIPTEPFFFLKPTTSYLTNGGTIELPKGENVQCVVFKDTINGREMDSR